MSLGVKKGEKEEGMAENHQVPAQYLKSDCRYLNLNPTNYSRAALIYSPLPSSFPPSFHTEIR